MRRGVRKERRRAGGCVGREARKEAGAPEVRSVFYYPLMSAAFLIISSMVRRAVVAEL
jgi:hypothetical protein